MAVAYYTKAVQGSGPSCCTCSQMDFESTNPCAGCGSCGDCPEFEDGQSITLTSTICHNDFDTSSAFSCGECPNIDPPEDNCVTCTGTLIGCATIEFTGTYDAGLGYFVGTANYTDPDNIINSDCGASCSGTVNLIRTCCACLENPDTVCWSMNPLASSIPFVNYYPNNFVGWVDAGDIQYSPCFGSVCDGSTTNCIFSGGHPPAGACPSCFICNTDCDVVSFSCPNVVPYSMTLDIG